MKTISFFISCFSVCVICAVLQSSYAASPLTITDFATDCADAAHNLDKANGFFAGSGTLLEVKNSAIRVITLKPSIRAAVDVIGIIEKGEHPEVDAEIPRLTTICKNAQVQTPTVPNGVITFASKKDDKITITFHLLKGTAPGGLKHTHWKATANDSIWMVQYPPGAKHDPPNRNDWPTCMLPKHVVVSGPDMSFAMCANNTGTELDYEYALHMDQVGSDKVPVELVIDPVIINHP